MKLESVGFKFLDTRRPLRMARIEHTVYNNLHCTNLVWAELHCQGVEGVEHAGQHYLLIGRDLWSSKLQIQWKVVLVSQNIKHVPAIWQFLVA